MTIATNETFCPFCFECGGQVILAPPNGMTREIYNGVHVAIPEHFRIPTCQTCANVIWCPEITDAIDSEIG